MRIGMRWTRIVLLAVAGMIWLSSAPRALANKAPKAYALSYSIVPGSVRVPMGLPYFDPDSGQKFRFTLTKAAAHGMVEYWDYSTQSYKPVPLNTSLEFRTEWYYTPDAGYMGADSYQWKVNDGFADSNIATCSITVKANTPPTAISSSTCGMA